MAVVKVTVTLDEDILFKLLQHLHDFSEAHKKKCGFKIVVNTEKSEEEILKEIEHVGSNLADRLIIETPKASS